MFYNKFVESCNRKNVSRTKACLDCGVSRTAWHKWENGATPNGTTINKFAVYFGVSVGYLLDEVDNIAPAVLFERNILDEVDIGFYQSFRELTEEQKEAVRDLVMLLHQRQVNKQD